MTKSQQLVKTISIAETFWIGNETFVAESEVSDDNLHLYVVTKTSSISLDNKSFNASGKQILIQVLFALYTKKPVGFTVTSYAFSLELKGDSKKQDP